MPVVIPNLCFTVHSITQRQQKQATGRSLIKQSMRERVNCFWMSLIELGLLFLKGFASSYVPNEGFYSSATKLNWDKKLVLNASHSIAVFWGLAVVVLPNSSNEFFFWNFWGTKLLRSLWCRLKNSHSNIKQTKQNVEGNSSQTTTRID
jgi:hypothetical protein